MKGTADHDGRRGVEPDWEWISGTDRGVGQRRAGILAILLVPLASKHPLAFSKVNSIIVFVLSIGVGVVVVGNGVQASILVC